MKRTDFSRVKKKTESKGVRFKQDLFERIQKEYNVKTGQQVLDVLETVFERLYIGLPGNPVLERAASRITKEAAEEQAKPKDLRSIINYGPKNALNKEEDRLVIDFGDDLFLKVEKYTKYPWEKTPTDPVGKAQWNKEKEAYDNKIREAWRNK